MKQGQRALLLVGSARRPQSTSQALGDYLLKRLAEHGAEVETILLHRAVQSEDRWTALLEQTDLADVIVLAFPLYVDSPPATVIRALELISEHRAAGAVRPGQRLLAIINSGFPEAKHNHTAATICELFARQAGFEWAGALTLGGGGAISGRPLEEVGGGARLAIQALDLAAAAISAGEVLPPAANETMSRPVIPPRVYCWMGWLGWRMEARKNGMARRLYARPYTE